MRSAGFEYGRRQALFRAESQPSDRVMPNGNTVVDAKFERLPVRARTSKTHHDICNFEVGKVHKG